ncbi:GSCOCG00011242001-RA-CDS, partial [Cotesia congregata]
IQRLEELRHKIELNMRKESERQEKYHGVNHEIPEVSVGDLVYYPNRKLSNKAAGYSASLGVKYLGPVMVSKIISPLVVELKNDKGKVLGQHYVPDLKIPRRSRRVVNRKL